MDVTYEYALEWSSDSLVHEIGMHMHTLGSSGSVKVEHADGRETTLVELDDWDFNWQMSYRMAEPVLIRAGDTVSVTCTFDNPTGQDANWGEGSNDEMCFGIMLTSTID